MEKHKCKLCFRQFSNGRALGGHMRSHMMNLQVPPKPNESPPPPPPTIQLSFEAESASSPPHSSSSEDKQGLCYGLRENPKRSFRLSDPEFADTGSVILQDRESETESSKNPTRKRSKRAWKLSVFDHNKQSEEQEQQEQTMKKIKISIPKSNKNESLSSVSDTTTEEDVAFCLMMLSRDKWKRQHELLEHKYEEQEQEQDEEEEQEEDDDEDEDDEEEESDESEEEMKSTKITPTTTTRVRGKYKCETCNKVFRSYQALGGHRASHKKIKIIVEEQPQLEHDNNNNHNNNNGVKKIHECPVCFRVFASGQALGGHKRTHVMASATTPTVTATATAPATPVRSFTKFGDSLIDLNLPAPMDDEDVSQIEDSAVSDAEFVKPH